MSNMNEALFEKLYKDYKKYIELGVYKNGDKLPSIRVVAAELGINPNTVQRAFKMLEDDGLIESINKKGLYVRYKSNDEKLKENIKSSFVMMKNEGVSKKLLLEIMEEVYNDWN